MLPELLLGLGVLGLCEGVIFLLRRQVRDFTGGVLFHLAAIGLALWLALVDTPWAAREPEPLLWQLLCTAILVILALALFSLCEILVLERPWRSQQGPMMPALVRDMLRLLIAISVGIAAATYIHGIPLPTVLVSSTVISAVLGLALQDVLRNVFAGMSLQLEGSVKVGDWLLFDDVPAAVLEMSWRAVRLRTNEGVEMLEPNGKLADQRLVRYGSGQRPVAFSFHVGLPYQTPPAEARTALLAAARSAPGVVKQPPSAVFLHEYGESSIVYELRVWTQDVQRISYFRDGVHSRIWYEIQRAGLYVPFPIRTVELHDSDRGEAAARQREIERIAGLLGEIELFAKLPPATRQELAQAARKQYFDHGEHLMREGEAGDSLFILDRGRVVVSKSGQVIGTGTVKLAQLTAGSFFGEMSFLTGAKRTATVTADGGCEILVLGKEALAPILSADPTIAETLSKALAERQAATHATFEERRARHDSNKPLPDHVPLLKRIRDFFRLSHR